MTIGICSDHAGLEYKTKLIAYLLKKGYEVVNFGTDSPESCDYSDFAHPLAEAVESGKVDKGIAICGTGNGYFVLVLFWGVYFAFVALFIPVLNI